MYVCPLRVNEKSRLSFVLFFLLFCFFLFNLCKITSDSTVFLPLLLTKRKEYHEVAVDFKRQNRKDAGREERIGTQA